MSWLRQVKPPCTIRAPIRPLAGSCAAMQFDFSGRRFWSAVAPAASARRLPRFCRGRRRGRRGRTSGARTGSRGRRGAPLDVRDTRRVADLARALGRLDILVNAAGIIRRDEELDPAVFADVVDINLNGACGYARACRGPCLRPREGRSSTSPRCCPSSVEDGCRAYSASKGGVAH